MMMVVDKVRVVGVLDGDLRHLLLIVPGLRSHVDVYMT